MTESNKGLFHAVLAVAGLAELLTARSRSRKFLVGVCAGWHAYATYEHFTTPKRLKK